MSDDCPKCPDCPPEGLPAWMGTFADLMSLLMCFFVLLLAMSEMDVLKFKQIAGSMKYAFGVQNKIEVKDIPKGTSVIAQEFRPGRPDPTPIEIINQQTAEVTQRELDYQSGEDANSGGKEQQRGDQRGAAAAADSPSDAEKSAAQEETNQELKKMAEKLEEQIEDGAIEIESLGQQIIIRIREKGSFPSGSANLQPRFVPVITKVGELLADIPGEITVSGHTDSDQLHTELYKSNWELSSLRAVAVAHELVKVRNFNPSRLQVVGLADMKPLTDGTDVLSQRRNRRVEISIMQGKAKESKKIGLTE
ncbi:flagellar motor protein MotB [Psychrobium sp. MM17-31]|uniref:flagellar motor protein MotB n=1 Tax=Psychrobium sp. MM17-31 TaxID=2917758 RepID=UPI001EF60942|nr:flagellar motor protein MotB [Psychrobium sp. MM17-31]MCG7531004.1 flagellar motor protein MotB [Psychrobium sp. MM17-31]